MDGVVLQVDVLRVVDNDSLSLSRVECAVLDRVLSTRCSVKVDSWMVSSGLRTIMHCYVLHVQLGFLISTLEFVEICHQDAASPRLVQGPVYGGVRLNGDVS